MAADLPVSVPASIPAPVFNWTGFYAGVNLGYNWGSIDSRYVGNNAFIAGIVNGGLVPNTVGNDIDGWIGGGQIGYNWQFGQFVAGLEADFNFSNAQDSVVNIRTVGLNSVTSVASIDVNWLSTIRGRLGFAFDRVLVYGTGGFAFGEVEGTATLTGNGGLNGLFWSGSSSDTRTGWTIGAGVEFAATQNILIRLEYLYYDLGSFNVTAVQTAGPATGFVASRDVDVTGNIVRGAVNFKF
jgi:outer membrane immunogenic protein